MNCRRQWHPTAVLLPGKSHGWRSLVDCSPWGHKASDMTEWLHFHFSLSCIGEGNGNSLQCSCLENPRDGGAWWAAIYGVTQSRTRLKWLSSSSSRNTTYFYILVFTLASLPNSLMNSSSFFHSVFRFSMYRIISPINNGNLLLPSQMNSFYFILSHYYGQSFCYYVE